MEHSPVRRRIDDTVAVLVALVGVVLALTPPYRPVLPGESSAWWWVDLAGGLLLCAALLGRRRAPLLVAVIITVGSVLVTTAWLTGLVAAFALAVRRPWPWAALVTVAGLWTGFVQVGFRALTPASVSWSTPAWAAAISAAVVASGYAIGVRRALLDSLVERAERAETEAALRAEAARAAERTRIAREMHDVLAHRLSLLSMHAGALSHRRHPEPEEVREAVEVIRANASDALGDLRAILGVLRAADDTDSGVEPATRPPQPTLADLPRLLAGVRATGTSVDLHDALDDELPDEVGRTLYRVAQEALTNAARHAPGQPVTVHLSGTSGADVHLEVGNPLAHGHRWSVGSGNGLVGIAERVELAGGQVLSADSDGAVFRLAVVLPWRGRVDHGAVTADAGRPG